MLPLLVNRSEFGLLVWRWMTAMWQERVPPTHVKSPSTSTSHYCRLKRWPSNWQLSCFMVATRAPFQHHQWRSLAASTPRLLKNGLTMAEHDVAPTQRKWPQGSCTPPPSFYGNGVNPNIGFRPALNLSHCFVPLHDRTIFVQRGYSTPALFSPLL